MSLRVLGLSTFVFAVACSSTSAKSGGGGSGGQDPGQTAPTGDDGSGTTTQGNIVIPYGVAYPAQPPFTVAGRARLPRFRISATQMRRPAELWKGPSG
jgi:hypothetical protein